MNLQVSVMVLFFFGIKGGGGGPLVPYCILFIGTIGVRFLLCRGIFKILARCLAAFLSC